MLSGPQSSLMCVSHQSFLKGKRNSDPRECGFFSLLSQAVIVLAVIIFVDPAL